MKAILIIIGLVFDLAAGFFAADRFGRFLDRHLRISSECPAQKNPARSSSRDWLEQDDETNWMNHLPKQ